MDSLKQLSLGGLIRSQVSPSSALFTPLTTISEDMKNIWRFLKDHEGLLTNTPKVALVSTESGLDGRTLYSDQNAISGFLFSTVANRPKTISESLSELYKTIDVSILESDYATELSDIKRAVGLSSFYTGVPSETGSVNDRINDINLSLSQLAADIFNRDSSIGDLPNEEAYNFLNDGKQTQETSIKDLLMSLVEVHGGIGNLTHEHVIAKHVWGVSISDDIMVMGNTIQRTTVFATGNIFEVGAAAQKYYNPFSKEVTITSLAITVTDNTLSVGSSVRLLVNGSPTGLALNLALGQSGRFKNALSRIVLQPDDYIQFEVHSGLIPSGHLKISNLSVIIEENN